MIYQDSSWQISTHQLDNLAQLKKKREKSLCLVVFKDIKIYHSRPLK